MRQHHDHLGRLLRKAARAFEAELTARLQARGYPDIRPGHGALFANMDAAGTRAYELARRARMTQPSMAELIDDLEQKGYVVRREDPSDRRGRLVVPTERGRRHMEDARAIIAEIEHSWLERFGPDQGQALLEALRQLAADRSPTGRSPQRPH
jgi:DNA-binding MarR family transcriptional regulator